MSETPRESLANALSTLLGPEQLSKLVDEVLAIEKRATGDITCKHCGRRQHAIVMIPDAKAVALALPDLLNQAYGRPQEASLQNDPVVFKRLTLVDEDEVIEDALRSVQENRRRYAEQRLEDGEVHHGSNGSGSEQAEGDPDLQGEPSTHDEAA